ncbi:hypothetical protein PRIC1_014449 [Phytophthora ramorum]
MVLATSDGSELVQDAHRKAFALNPFMAVVIARFPGCRNVGVWVDSVSAVRPEQAPRSTPLPARETDTNSSLLETSQDRSVF